MTYKQEKKYEIYLRFPFSLYTIVISCNVSVSYARQILENIVFVLSIKIIINCYTTNVDSSLHIFSFGLDISAYIFFNPEQLSPFLFTLSICALS